MTTEDPLDPATRKGAEHNQHELLSLDDAGAQLMLDRTSVMLLCVSTRLGVVLVDRDGDLWISRDAILRFKSELAGALATSARFVVDELPIPFQPLPGWAKAMYAHESTDQENATDGNDTPCFITEEVEAEMRAGGDKFEPPPWMCFRLDPAIDDRIGEGDRVQHGPVFPQGV